MKNFAKHLLLIVPFLFITTLYGQTKSSSFSVREAYREGIIERLSDEIELISNRNILYCLDTLIVLTDSLYLIKKESVIDKIKSFKLQESELIRLNNKILELDRSLLKDILSLKRAFYVAMLDDIDDNIDKMLIRFSYVKPKTISGEKELRECIILLERQKGFIKILIEHSNEVNSFDSVLPLIKSMSKDIESIYKIGITVK